MEGGVCVVHFVLKVRKSWKLLGVFLPINYTEKKSSAILVSHTLRRAK